MPLASPRDGVPVSGHDQRASRPQVLLDALGYDGDRRAFGTAVPHRPSGTPT
ncbi:hypothetical protein GCM10009827_009760 [Dactylosporangium maewongense]|uniref:Uncharacterized protein n=1 Tax=Dactylosporangium maewongense TaxID=634393 RepID=A0ABN1ZMQ3_9ACTN